MPFTHHSTPTPSAEPVRRADPHPTPSTAGPGRPTTPAAARGAGWGWLLVALAPLVCCGLPLVLSAGVFASLTGAAWVGIGAGLAAVVVIAAAVMAYSQGRAKQNCCRPGDPGDLGPGSRG